MKSPEQNLKLASIIPASRERSARRHRGRGSRTRPATSASRSSHIHGFSTTFDEAVQRAASIGYGLKIPVMGVFSWPSKGAVADYVADINAASASSQHLASFLVDFVTRTGATKVHLIAHSMGNYGLLQAILLPGIQDLAKRHVAFGQVILAAPDVDRDIFMRDAPAYLRIAERVTLYASDRDKALVASRKLADFPRAGLLPPATIVDGIDTVDVSKADLTWLGHSYVADELTVLRDMHELMAHNAPPAKRNHLKPAADDPRYWVLY